MSSPDREATRYCQDYEDTSPCADMTCPNSHWYRAADYDTLRRVAEKLTTAVRIWANHPDRGFPRHLSEEAQVMIEVLASAEAVLTNVALRQADADYEAGGFSKIN